MNSSTDVMNVNMVEHQRSILAVLGIDVWMPKVNAPVQNYTSSLYRDQAAPEQLHPIHPQAFDAIPFSSASAVDTKSSSTVKVEPTADVSVRSKVEDAPAEKIAQPTLDVREAIQIDAFELQAWCTETHVILVNSTDLSHDENELWRNIQRSKPGQFFDLKWPFALEPLQDGRGAQVYVQGFLDAMRAEKTLLSLGQCDHVKHVEMQVLSSLQQMLQHPQLKRELWGAIK